MNEAPVREKAAQWDSPAFHKHAGVCRECNKLQIVITVRGWKVCLLCLEAIDRRFTTERAKRCDSNTGRIDGIANP